MTSRWKHSRLDTFRKTGDEMADRLVHDVLNGTEGTNVGRRGYNIMLDLADQLAQTPELVLTRDSKLMKRLGDMPDDLPEFFSPIAAPHWVDERKLRLGSSLWQRNQLIMLGVLYSASLPACYLIAKGIPALYETGKLRNPKYLFQRIYEPA